MNKNPEVDRYLDDKDHALTAEIQRVREIILSASPEIEETIKWSSPTFMYEGNMASFFMNAKKHVSLVFHKGATLSSGNGLLVGEGKEARTAKFKNMEEIEERKADLEAVVREWVESRKDG